MRQTFTYMVKPNKSQEKIVKELMWHSIKVYNMLNYDVREGKDKIKEKGLINVNGSINILRKYIKNIFSPNLEIAMDIGREQRPLKKRVA